MFVWGEQLWWDPFAVLHCGISSSRISCLTSVCFSRKMQVSFKPCVPSTSAAQMLWISLTNGARCPHLGKESFPQAGTDLHIAGTEVSCEVGESQAVDVHMQGRCLSSCCSLCRHLINFTKQKFLFPRAYDGHSLYRMLMPAWNVWQRPRGIALAPQMA